MHLLGQTGHRAVEAGGGQSLPVSESVQRAWTGSPALGQMPGETNHRVGGMNL